MIGITSRRRPPGKPFYTVLLAVSLLTVFSWLRRPREGPISGYPDGVLDARSFAARDGQCRLVHSVPEKCAFIRANCPDEDAGLLSYLQFYYCNLAGVKPVAFIILILWLGLLFSTIGIAASDFLCINLSTIASVLGMSESLTGVTFLAFGNGSPDVFSTFAAMSSHNGSLAVGELFGAAGFITAVVAASMALVKPFHVPRKSFVRDVGFFIVAASFSMYFLVDGKLVWWECAAMVGFYVFYVIFVVTWHWWLNRRRRRRLRDRAARLHLNIRHTQELDTSGYNIDEDEDTPDHERTYLFEEANEERDFPALERQDTPTWKIDEIDDDDEARDRYLAELRSNMRVNRQQHGERRSATTPIRPSLIGALEFRAVLSSLERRATNRPTRAIDLQRYSDGLIPRAVQDGSGAHRDSGVHLRPAYHQSAVSCPGHVSDQRRRSVGGDSLQLAANASSRGRAVSADNAAGLKSDAAFLPDPQTVPGTALSSAFPLPSRREPSQAPGHDIPTLALPNTSPQLPVSDSQPAAGEIDERHLLRAPPSSTSDTPQRKSSSLLVPPADSFHRPNYYEDHHDRSPSPGGVSPMMKPRKEVPQLLVPHAHSDLAHPTSSFLTYTDSPAVLTPMSAKPPSIRLPEPNLSTAPVTDIYLTRDESPVAQQALKWWPYKYLPLPQVIAATLFPTVYGWREKSIWDKLLGIVSVPSVFLLSVTLPVVEPQKEDPTNDQARGVVAPGDFAHSRANTNAPLPPDSPSIPALHSPRLNPHKAFRPNRPNSEPYSIASIPTDDSIPSSPREWNRWLVILQLFTAPFFVSLIVYANLEDTAGPKAFLILTLSALVFSLICLLILLATTTSTEVPKYRPLLCFLGFLVAIAWISTVANEVVGVLKAFGVILGISDAILGLTVFAVGNSLGDLVADITVARLGFPVMALSACFGGPMLNILLGIGIGGLYMNIVDGRHRKHPNRPFKYKPFELEVSTTLTVSGVTLLITLVGLLIFVPLNGWRMDRKIGLGLIVLWTLSMIGNVAVEVLGYGGDLALGAPGI